MNFDICLIFVEDAGINVDKEEGQYITTTMLIPSRISAPSPTNTRTSTPAFQSTFAYNLILDNFMQYFLDDSSLSDSVTFYLKSDCQIVLKTIWKNYIVIVRTRIFEPSIL
jgi:hypothetical protein